jgi:hypothetical protein
MDEKKELVAMVTLFRSTMPITQTHHTTKSLIQHEKAKNMI